MIDTCGYCNKDSNEVPLVLVDITMMDGRNWTEIVCPNCANRVHRSGDVFEVRIDGNVGYFLSIQPVDKGDK